MRMRTIRAVAAYFVIVLLLPGCATLPEKHEPTQSAPSVQTLVKSARSWDGALLPSYPQGQPEVTILWIEIPPGARLERHTHPVINAGVLISGRLTVVTDEGDTLTLKAGDPIVEVVETIHYGYNPGQEPAVIVVFYAGSVDNPITLIEPQRDGE